MTKAAIFGWLVACIWLVGCRPAAEPSVGSPPRAIEPAANTPEATARAFFRACVAGDQAAVLDLLAPLTRQAVVSSDSNPCRHVLSAAEGLPDMEVETAGQTAYVRYQWQQDGVAAQGELVLIQENKNWLIADSQVAYRRPTPALPGLPAVPTLIPR